MNMGGRIGERLKQLGWQQKDLLDRGPDVSAATLSNLIKRDSIRSEKDVSIAAALGVSIMWLVYGEGKADDAPGRSADNPVLQDLAALEPEDADVWRAQIKAAAVKARKAKSAAAAAPASPSNALRRKPSPKPRTA